MKKIISLLLTLLTVLSAVGITAFAEMDFVKVTDENNEVLYSVGVDTNDLTVNSRPAIQEALNLAKDNYNEDKILTVTLPKGNYSIGSGLSVYSNTVFNLNKSVLYRGENCGVLLRNGKNKKQVYGYADFKNITVKNGIVDADRNGTSSVLKFEHAENLTFENITVRNSLNTAHLLTFAACNNVRVYECEFYDMDLGSLTSNCEAIQIDILKEPYYLSGNYYDGTPTKNVYIENCKFKNVDKGVGTHSGITGHYFDNINIKNNTFEKITGYAIRTVNYINSEISGNNIISAACGILVGNMTTPAQVNYFAPMKGYGEKPINKLNITVKNNTVNLIDTNYSFLPYGIQIFGLISKNFKDPDGVTYSGDYRVSKIAVTDNTITSTVLKKNFYGIKLSGCYGTQSSEKSNFTVKNNKIISNCSKVSSFTNYGIKLENCDKIACFDNDISDISSKRNLNYGIYLLDSKNNYIKSNIIKKPTSAGIKFYKDKGSFAISNTVTSSKGYGIYSYSSTLKKLSQNTLKNSKSSAIFINERSSIEEINGNIISKPSGNGIYLSNRSTVKYIKNNSVTAPKNNGIYLNSGSSATAVSANTVSESENCGIALNDKAKAKRIRNNTVTSPKGYGIYCIGNCEVESVYKNTVASSQKNALKSAKKANIISIKKNNFYNSSVSAIILTGKAKTKQIIGNKIDSVQNSLYSICIISNSTVEIIDKNKINRKSNIQTAELEIGSKNGIYIKSKSCNIKSICNNRISTCQNGIFIEKAKTKAKVDKNKFNDCKTGIYYKKANIGTDNKYLKTETAEKKIPKTKNT